MRLDVYEPGVCAEKCFAMPACGRCGRTKAPRGRDVGAYMVGHFCDWDCPGYNDEPKSGHLWPQERPGRNQI